MRGWAFKHQKHGVVCKHKHKPSDPLIQKMGRVGYELIEVEMHERPKARKKIRKAP